MLLIPIFLQDKKDFDPQKVLDSIDSKISLWSTHLMENLTLGFQTKINYTKINNLLLLKGVYERMVKGSNDYSFCLEEVIAKINTITNTTC